MSGKPPRPSASHRSILYTIYAIIVLGLIVGGGTIVALVYQLTHMHKMDEDAVEYHLAIVLHISELESTIAAIERETLYNFTDGDHPPIRKIVSKSVGPAVATIDLHCRAIQDIQQRYADPAFEASTQRMLAELQDVNALVDASSPEEALRADSVSRRLSLLRIRCEQLDRLHTNAFRDKDATLARSANWSRFVLLLGIGVGGSVLLLLLLVQFATRTIRTRDQFEQTLVQSESRYRAIMVELHQKNIELEQFVYTVSHDLKSPLITIKGFLGLIEQDLDGDDADECTEHLQTIGTAADRMNELLDDLLTLARLGRVEREPETVPLAELAREAARVVTLQIDDRTVTLDVSDDLPVVSVDRHIMLQVFQNLIGNATRFMGEQPEPRIDVGCRNDGNECVVFVRDNGIGIEPEFHDRIFGLFEQLNPEAGGTGIGLKIVSRTIELHGGRIWVESNGAGEGTTFCFTIKHAPQ